MLFAGSSTLFVPHGWQSLFYLKTRDVFSLITRRAAGSAAETQLIFSDISPNVRMFNQKFLDACFTHFVVCFCVL